MLKILLPHSFYPLPACVSVTKNEYLMIQGLIMGYSTIFFSSSLVLMDICQKALFVNTVRALCDGISLELISNRGDVVWQEQNIRAS